MMPFDPIYVLIGLLNMPVGPSVLTLLGIFLLVRFTLRRIGA